MCWTDKDTVIAMVLGVQLFNAISTDSLRTVHTLDEKHLETVTVINGVTKIDWQNNMIATFMPNIQQLHCVSKKHPRRLWL